MSHKIIEVSDGDFDQKVLDSDIPVLLDFWAEWCGPCKMIVPLLEQISENYEGKLQVCKMNIDQNVATPTKYNVKGIPTLMIFKNGNIEGMKVGALTKSQLTEFVNGCI